jgi:alpha-1,2-glucosyltransferase
LNTLALLSLTKYALDIRGFLTSPSYVLRSRKLTTISTEAIHTAVNISLFPPLFFFSGLFYTDVLSTTFTLLAYRCFLDRKGVRDNSRKGLILNYVIGILALTMRQTNIFWVAIFLAGAEAVGAVKMNVIPEAVNENKVNRDSGPLMTEIRRWGRGDIHDIALEDANLIGKLSTHCVRNMLIRL